VKFIRISIPVEGQLFRTQFLCSDYKQTFVHAMFTGFLLYFSGVELLRCLQRLP